MLRLQVMRHAKSDWGSGSADHDRPLNTRGREAADAMGRQLRAWDLVPELVLASTAERARTTVERAALAGEWDCPIETRHNLYMTSPAGALTVLAAAPDTVTSVMLVGHQPTWSELVERLTGGRVRVATATVIGIDLDIASWSMAPSARGEITHVLQARHVVRD